MKLKKLYENIKDESFTVKEKKEFIKAISEFNNFGKQIYRTSEINEAIETITELVEKAQKITIGETADWFDGVSVKRDMKSLGESLSLFNKTAREMSGMQQRMESLYEDMGYKLGKYFSIAEKLDNIDDKEAAMDFEDLPDKDIDNDGDTDKSDKYLHHKLGNVAKRTENRFKKLAAIKK